MLITQNTADLWFRKDSFIYKQYIFLFRNPLWWKKKEPKGASLCPYFWMALFSFFIFKPIVYVIKAFLMLLKPLLILGGQPIKALDGFVIRKIARNHDIAPGGGVMLTVLFTVLTVLVSMLGYMVIVSLHHLYQACQAQFVFIYVFWGILSTIALFVGIFSHYLFTSSDSDRCKSEVYLYYWAAGVILLSATAMTSDFIAGLGVIASGFITGMLAILHFAWFLISGFWTYIVIGGTKLIWSIISFGYVIGGVHIPWILLVLATFAITGAIVVMVDKLLHVTEGKVTYRESWCNLICNAIRKWDSNIWDPIYYSIRYDENCAFLTEAERGIYWKSNAENLNLRLRIVEHLVRYYVNKKFNSVLKLLEQKSLPYSVHFIDWNKLYNTSPGSRCDVLSSVLGVVIDSKLFDEDTVKNVIIPYIRSDEYMNFVRREIAFIASLDAAKIEKQERRNNSISRRMCKAFTQSAYKKINTAIDQAGIFCHYMGELAKAKKQGACPYMRFTDIVAPEVVEPKVDEPAPQNITPDNKGDDTPPTVML